MTISCIAVFYDFASSYPQEFKELWKVTLPKKFDKGKNLGKITRNKSEWRFNWTNTFIAGEISSANDRIFSENFFKGGEIKNIIKYTWRGLLIP